MSRMNQWLVPFLAVVVVLAALFGCDQSTPPQNRGGSNSSPRNAAPPPTAARVFTIWSGSENRSLAPIVEQFAQTKGTRIEWAWKGSVDIAREAQRGTQATPNAIWPASRIWISLGNTKGTLKMAKSTHFSPVGLGVELSSAKALGWVKGEPNYIGRDPTIDEVIKAMEGHRLRTAITSCTQSNSGANVLFAALHVFAGSPEEFTVADLQKPGVADRTAALFGAIDRTAESSNFLADAIVERDNFAKAMFNYEVLVIETNERLQEKNRGGAQRELLYMVYPQGGVMSADSPLAYVDKGNAQDEEFFKGLQTYLLSESVQRQIVATGRRSGNIALDPATLDTARFRTDWGIDYNRTITSFNFATDQVVREGLKLYQDSLRPPTVTLFLCDKSGSMGPSGTNGNQYLMEAMDLLLDPVKGGEYLIAPSARDITIVQSFSTTVDAPLTVSGNDSDQLREVYEKLRQRLPAGGTALFAALAQGIKELTPYTEGGKYRVQVIIMTDGVPDDQLDNFRSATANVPGVRDIPVWIVLFGDAVKYDANKKIQNPAMQSLVDYLYGQMYDGSKDLVGAMRKATGNAR